jgi:hypothetical protein
LHICSIGSAIQPFRDIGEILSDVFFGRRELPQCLLCQPFCWKIREFNAPFPSRTDLIHHPANSSVQNGEDSMNQYAEQKGV